MPGSEINSADHQVASACGSDTSPDPELDPHELQDPDVQRALLAGELLALAVVRDQVLHYASPGFLSLFGVDGSAGDTDLAALTTLLLDSVSEQGGAEAVTDEPLRVVCSVQRFDGSTRRVELRGHRTPLQGAPGVVLVASDISELAQDLSRFKFLALHDPLTGLANRVLMQDRLEQAVVAARRHGHGCAALLIDLDGFKAVNDRHGHDTGDELLRQVAARLRSCARESDTVARYGGDEFVLVASRIGSHEDAALVAARIIDTLSGEYEVGARHCSIGASVGVAVCLEPDIEPALLLSQADAAMYLAKGSGKNRYAFPEVSREAIRLSEQVEWPPERDVGIPEVDREHQQLCRDVNALMQRVRGDENTLSLALGVRELLDALRRHFATEERFMEQQPGLWDDVHRREHRRLLQDIRLITSVVTDQSVMLAIRYLVQWLQRHAHAHDSMLVAASGAPANQRRARRAR
jgi:diguanylate cyclase (GGDEF)-like protein/hemerythrin-like metal-binding protein